jgi:hypothetical protein
MKHLKFLILFILSTQSIDSFSQIGITSYSINSVGINTSQNKRISGEIKTFANRPLRDILMEIDGFYNFKPKPYHRFSIGLGVNVAPFKEYDQFYALTIPASIEIYPLQNFKKLSLLFELAPEILPEDGVNLRSLWGVRYSFGKKDD